MCLKSECIQLWVAVIGASALFISALITGAVRKYALLHGVIDVPNERSSHQAPTPRGGGVAIVVAATCAFLALYGFGSMDARLLLGLMGGIPVAVVGFVDDRRRLSVRVRFAVHLAAAVWAMYWAGGLPPLRFGDHLITLGWSGYVLGLLGIVWVLNLFNFMDGIDGLAVSQAMFVSWGGALLAVIAGLSVGVTGAALALGAACCGFAVWNWPPAKIFMGDVGSCYLGYVIAVLALAAGHESSVALLAWLLLGAAFFVDATVTLARRLARFERIHAAHRSHAYQWLARRWGTHRRVTLAFIAVNLTWLLPCALIATLAPGAALGVLMIALVPLVVLAWVAGAGRSESFPRP